MGVLSWALFGLLAGWIAGIITRDGRPRGCLMNMATGVVGALLGGLVYRLATGDKWTFEFDFASFGVAVLGAIALIIVINLATRRR